MLFSQIIDDIKSHASPINVEGMARFGIKPKKTYGVPMPLLRKMGKRAGKDHQIAQKLWKSGIHEAMILASLVDDPAYVTPKQMDQWVMDFDSWGLCDQCCSNLFDKTPFAYDKAIQWSKRKEEFVKRAGFTLMAVLAVHDKKTHDKKFEKFLKIVMANSTDDRNFVKKAANWALRQIGKRNKELNNAAIETAKKIQTMDSKTARWIASDAIRELTSENVRKKFKNVG
jgi:3-methyladenine DNA glycosylase AlkD